MATPFHDDLSVNYDMASKLAKHLVAEGSDGLVIAGSTGEGNMLSDEEKLGLFETVAKAVTVPVIAGTSGSDTARAVELTTAASKTGVAGLPATPPPYVRPSQQGLFSHVGAMAAATTLPVMVYDIPSRTGRKIL